MRQKPCADESVMDNPELLWFEADGAQPPGVQSFQFCSVAE